MKPPDFCCLAVETATDFPSLALVRGSQVAVRAAEGLQTPSRAIYVWLQELLDETGTRLDQLDCLAFGAGPGSFTGVRVAAALVQAIGFSRQLPVLPVSTLAALAMGGFRASGPQAVACCLDARMGQVYMAVYAPDDEWGVHALQADALLQPEEVSSRRLPSCFAAGSGWLAYPELRNHFAEVITGMDAGLRPAATDIATLAYPKFLRGQTVAPALALPNYLRDRVAWSAA
ncbi:MAG: tRNA (adenosine(37)-N6)-threonylcarbamoyltransferase complex dimerization subunit type 1 TsaB [Gammaproteobacteria bacterium]